MAGGTRRFTDRLDLTYPTGYASGELIKMGSSTVPIKILTTAQEMVGLYTTSALTGGATIESMKIKQVYTGAAHNVSIHALRVEAVSAVRAGSTMNAIYAKLDYSTAGYAHGGGAAICGEIVMPSTAPTRGTYSCFTAELGATAGTTQIVSFMNMSAWGDGVASWRGNGSIFEFSGLGTATTLKIHHTNTLRIRLNGTNKYLIYGDAEQGVHLGTSGSKQTLLASLPFMSVYTTTAATSGTMEAVKFDFTATVASHNHYMRALRINVTSNVKTGASFNAIYAKMDYSTGGYAHGEAAVIVGELVMPSTQPVRGTYQCFKAELGVTTIGSQTLSFMGMNAWGTLVAQWRGSGCIFDINGVGTATSNKVFQANNNTASHALRIKVNGTSYYMLLSDTSD